jgi:Tfp pilus assembly protein PilX
MSARRPEPGPHRERGIALIMALLTLLVLSLLAVVLYTSVTVGTKITGHNLRESQALNTAEAGVAEACSRIANEEGPSLGAVNPAHQVVQIFNCAAGSVPVPGADTTGLATAQPAGTWLNYTASSRGPNVLTIEFKTDPTRTVVYRYDPSQNPHINTVSGYPIYRITSTGIEGADVRHVVAEVIRKPIISSAYGALVANQGIDFTGTSNVCGYNHSIDTPINTGQCGRACLGGCNEDPAAQHWELGTGDRAGAWCSQDVTIGGSSQQNGSPDTLTHQVGFYNGPWEALGMTQQQFFDWIGAPTNNMPDPPSGVYYLDNDGTAGNASGSYSIHGGDGEGLLYVDGDLSINGNFSFKGLVYIEGDLKVNGNCWILGAVICKGNDRIKVANGTCVVLYSKDAIEQKIAKWGGQFVTLSWRETQ